jgi:hypothetical protein
MRSVPALACVLVLGAASTASSQSDDHPLSRLEIEIACAPPTSFDAPAGRALHIAGAQDPSRRSLFGKNDLLVVDGGTNADVQQNQQYFVRRPVALGYSTRARGVNTLGWVRIVAVNESTAIASVQYMCDAIYVGDYLEPFVAPSVPADVVRAEPTGELDVAAIGRIVSAGANRSLGGITSLMLIDRGADQGAAAGSRFAVYRDLKEKDVPLSPVGEGVVVSVGKTMSLAWITKSRDAVVPGDYVVPRK